MANLEELVKQLTNPAPTFEDPEEDEGDVTRARVPVNDFDGDDDVNVEATQLRRRAGHDLLESDKRYKGERTSRKDLYDLEDSASGQEESDEEIDTADSEEIEESEDESEEDRGDDESDEEIASDDAGSAAEEEETDRADGVRQFSAVNREDEVAKGKAVVAQLDLWDRLMEGRIKLQRVLATVNSLPKPEAIQKLKEEGSQSQQQLIAAQSQLQSLLSVLLQIQAKLLHENPETKNVAGSASSHTSPSKESVKREREVEEEEATSAKRFAGFRVFRNETLEKWDNNTRLGSKLKSFSAFNTSVLKQIDQVLSDKDRLVKRTQVNRAAKNTEKVEAAHDAEVFNDDDFYHILLRELIERKNDSSDATDITRQWLEIQKMRSNVKRKTVDTRASKGRKLRYNIHKKMVNFMAPVDTSTWSTEAKNDLFKSLFKGSSTAEL
ncbi:hypothetical protein BaRGS_00028945 [Batillaria attramentaria]|uniref:Protein BFR2 n=1 Tax=Batillaria attramentaria TaxID=370345 RepID=A0ABD0JXA7_9CAEN